jgi:hypothetical protein
MSPGVTPVLLEAGELVRRCLEKDRKLRFQWDRRLRDRLAPVVPPPSRRGSTQGGDPAAVVR